MDPTMYPGTNNGTLVVSHTEGASTTSSLVATNMAAARETAEMVRIAERDVALLISREQEVAARMEQLQAQADEGMHQLVLAEQEELVAVAALQTVMDKEEAARKDVAAAIDAVNRAHALLARHKSELESTQAERLAKEGTLAPIFIKVRSLIAGQGRFRLLAEREVARHRAELATRKEQLLDHQIALNDVKIRLLEDPAAAERWSEVKGVIE